MMKIITSDSERLKFLLVGVKLDPLFFIEEFNKLSSQEQIAALRAFRHQLVLQGTLICFQFAVDCEIVQEDTAGSNSRKLRTLQLTILWIDTLLLHSQDTIDLDQLQFILSKEQKELQVNIIRD